MKKNRLNFWGATILTLLIAGAVVLLVRSWRESERFVNDLASNPSMVLNDSKNRLFSDYVEGTLTRRAPWKSFTTMEQDQIIDLSLHRLKDTLQQDLYLIVLSSHRLHGKFPRLWDRAQNFVLAGNEAAAILLITTEKAIPGSILNEHFFTSTTFQMTPVFQVALIESSSPQMITRYGGYFADLINDGVLGELGLGYFREKLDAIGLSAEFSAKYPAAFSKTKK